MLEVCDAGSNAIERADRMDPAEGAGRSKVLICALRAQIPDSSLRCESHARQELGERSLSFQPGTGRYRREHACDTSKLQGIDAICLYAPSLGRFRIPCGDHGWTAEVH